MSEYNIDSSEDEFADDENVVDDDTQGSMFEYVSHSHTFDDTDSINIFATKEVYNSINYNNGPVEKWNSKRKHEDSFKAKYMEKRQYTLKREYLTTVNHGEREYTVAPKFAHKLSTVTSNSVLFNLPRITTKEEITSTRDYAPNQQSKITQRIRNELEQKLQTRNTNKFDYFDKSQSDDEEEEKSTNIQRTTDMTDYVHVPAYDMEYVLADNRSKLK